MNKIISIPHLSVQVEYVCTSSLVPDPRNARIHSRRQIAKFKSIVAAYGFTNPVLIDEKSKVLAGHLRVLTAKALDMEEIPCIRLTHLSEAQKIGLAIADNKMSDESQFDPGALSKLLAELDGLDFQIELTGFDTAEIDMILAAPTISTDDPADMAVDPDGTTAPVTRVSDLWALGSHRLLCGNALNPADYELLLGDDKAEMVFTDPPYNLKINGHVSGLGKARHAEFAMASGELSSDDFLGFLKTTAANLCTFSTDGSIHFICMDWRHTWEISEAGKAKYSELKAVCVWNKTNGGMGSFYRSKHELIFVFKNGSAPHVNNIDLGRTGRYRTNVWDYPGVNTFGASRDNDLSIHPTVKPVALVADAIRDCSKRDAIILDPFAGSGTTILAAERTRRRAACMEIDPGYVDAAIRRWQTLAGETAILTDDGRSFDEVAASRSDMEVDHV